MDDIHGDADADDDLAPYILCFCSSLRVYQKKKKKKKNLLRMMIYVFSTGE